MVYRFIIKKRISNKFVKYLKEIKDSILIFSKSAFIIVILLNIIIQTLSAFSGLFLIHFLKAEISFTKILFANSAAFFLGAISMIPLGLGVRDGSVLFFIKSFGIPQNIAINFVAIQRIISTGLGYLLGVLAGGVLGVKSVNLNSLKLEDRNT